MNKLQKWSKDTIVQALIVAHKTWAKKHKKENISFNYSYLRKHFSALAYSLDRKKYFDNLIAAFDKAGINPDCHVGQYKYENVNNNIKGENTFKKVLEEIIDTRGVETLNDNSMNSDEKIDVPKALKQGHSKVYPLCKKANCKKNKMRLGSIYATGRRYYGNWENAVESIGISYKNDVLRKVAAREWFIYIEMFANFIKSNNNNFVIGDLKDVKENYPIYSGLTKNYRNKSPLSEKQPDIMLGSFIEANAYIDRKYDQLESYYEENFEVLKEQFYKQVLTQKVWTDRRRIKGKPSGITTRIQEELVKRYAEGRRITRGELENSGIQDDKTLVSAMRGRSRKEISDFVSTFSSAGFLNKKLLDLYAELDEPYPTHIIHKEFCRLFKESIEHSENRITREYCSQHEPEFHNAIIRIFKSWEAGLRKFGIDPKMYTLTASKRTKRAYVYQTFFNEMLIRYGFINVSRVSKIIEKYDYTSNKSILDCKHKIRCKPDFTFKHFIIDVKTGYAAKRQVNQLERYTSHRNILYIITLRGERTVEKRKFGKVHFLSFSDFIKNSKDILEVQINHAEEKLLTAALKLEPFWS